MPDASQAPPPRHGRLDRHDLGTVGRERMIDTTTRSYRIARARLLTTFRGKASKLRNLGMITDDDYAAIEQIVDRAYEKVIS